MAEALMTSADADAFEGMPFALRIDKVKVSFASISLSPAMASSLPAALE